jgi:hypothetical protein
MKKGVPEATFMKFLTDADEGEDAVNGGLFHVMMTYGLTQEEQRELGKLLKEAVPGAVLRGAVDLRPAGNGENFVVTSNTLTDEGFAPGSVLTSGRAPTQSGSRAAIAGRLSRYGATLLEASFENPTSDLTVSFFYDYVARTPALSGEIRIDTDLVHLIEECQASSQHKVDAVIAMWPNGKPLTGKKAMVTRSQMEDMMNVLQMTGAVTIQLDQKLPDADLSALEGNFMGMALEAFASMRQSFSDAQASGRGNGNGEGSDRLQAPKKKRWELYTVQRKQANMRGVFSFRLEKVSAIYRPHAMTANVGGILSQYKDQVYDIVDLDADDFFKWGKVTVEVDGEALDLFQGGMVNNALVKVIVPREQRDFEDERVFTRKSFEENDLTHVFTFATHDATVSQGCPFKYLEVWNLRGGGKWPRNARPHCADSSAIVLVPPIRARRIDVEADLGEMESAGIRAADVQLRYMQYGKQKSDTVKFRVVAQEPYEEKTIFIDKDNEVVEYRIVFNHQGKQLAPTQWQKLEGEYVYANLAGLPESDLRQLKSVLPQLPEYLQ